MTPITYFAWWILSDIKGTHNTVADAISQLEYNPKLNSTNEYNHATQGVSTKDLAHQKWNAFSKHWRGYNETNSQSNTNRVHLNQVFANRSEDDKIYPLTVSETDASKIKVIKCKLSQISQTIFSSFCICILA